MKNKKTLYHMILDRSGSMGNCRDATIEAFNSQLETIAELQLKYPEQEFRTSLTVFNNFVDHIVSNAEANSLDPLSRSWYRPGGSTALLDAIGLGIQRIEQQIGSEIENDEASVVVVILSDGFENSSQIFGYKDIAAMIGEKEKTDKWTFTFLGADIDAFEVASQINIHRGSTVSFNKKQMKITIDEINNSMRYYSDQKSKGKISKSLLEKRKNKDRS